MRTMRSLLSLCFLFLVSPAGSSCVPLYQRCGGGDYVGIMNCCTPEYNTCTSLDDGYSECRPNPLAASRAANSCAPLGGQCGGDGFYTGPKCCTDGECTFVTTFYSHCVLTAETPETAADQAAPPAEACAAVGKKCGGGQGYSSPTCCQEGSVCTSVGSGSLKKCKASSTGAPTATATLLPAAANGRRQNKCAPPQSDEPGFQITLFNRNCGTPYDSYFEAAAARWEEVVVGDLTGLPAQIWNWFISDQYGSYKGFVDDVIIAYDVLPMDGEGGMLGHAGPTSHRDGSGTAVAGIMVFDEADVQALEATGQLASVILHEMGHVLGIGTLWKEVGEPCSECNPTKAHTDYAYKCRGAQEAFNEAGFDGTLPLMSQGGEETRCSHWDESVLGSELMTGYVEEAHTATPLSAITVRSLEDLGYVVDASKADPFGPLNVDGRRLQNGRDNFNLKYEPRSGKRFRLADDRICLPGGAGICSRAV